MAGYTRQDVSNNIANGSVVDADDLDAEFDAVAGAFNASTGHTHDGTSTEGAPITVVGPAQDVSVTSAALVPKTNETYDLGSVTNEWKDLYVGGVANVGTLTADAGTVGGATITTASNTQTLTNKTLTNPTLEAPELTGEIYNNGPSSSNIVSVAALDIDCSAGNYFTKVINADSTFTFSNVPASRGYGFTLELTLISGTITWPAAVKFSGNATPITSSGKTHLFMFLTDDGGSRWRGAALVDYDT